MDDENRFMFGCFLVSHVLDIFVSKRRPINWSKLIFNIFGKRKLWIWINGLNSFKRPYSSITVPCTF